MGWGLEMRANAKEHTCLAAVAATVWIASIPIASRTSWVAVVKEGRHSEMNESRDLALVTK